jgi:hypothetical protein
MLDATRFGGLQIDEQLEIYRLLDRQVARLRSFHYLVRQTCGAQITATIAHPVGHQSAHFNKLARDANGWQTLALRRNGRSGVGVPA